MPRMQFRMRVYCDHVLSSGSENERSCNLWVILTLLLIGQAYAKSVSFAPTSVYLSRTSTGILPLMGADLFDDFTDEVSVSWRDK